MVVIVAAVAIWPIGHAMLVARFEVDPWELFGWSMYTQPAARVQVAVDVERGDERKPLRAMGALREQVTAFTRRRAALGTLTSSRSLADVVFGEDPSAEAVIVTIRRVRLDPHSALLVATEAEHRHERHRTNGDP
jgi:hypothetical protein